MQPCLLRTCLNVTSTQSMAQSSSAPVTVAITDTIQARMPHATRDSNPSSLLRGGRPDQSDGWVLTAPLGAREVDDDAYLMASQPLTVPCGPGSGAQEQLVQITATVSSTRLPAVLLAVDPGYPALARQHALPAFAYGQVPRA